MTSLTINGAWDWPAGAHHSDQHDRAMTTNHKPGDTSMTNLIRQHRRDSRQGHVGVKRTGRGMRASRLLATAVVLGALAVPAAAGASVTIGSNLDGTASSGFGGAAPRTMSQRTLVASHQAAGGLTSPINGVVVRWRVKAGPKAGPLKLRLIRPGGDDFAPTAAGTSAAMTPPIERTTSFGLNPGLPIRAGDGVGLDVEGDYYFNLGNAGTELGSVNVWLPPLTDGAEAFQAQIDDREELLLQAVIEPDKDGDRLGDESQDPDGGQPAPPPPPPAKKCVLLRLGSICI